MLAVLLRRSARWTFFATLLLAPWYYGGTTALSIVVINWLLGAVLLFWVAELVAGKRRPNFPNSLLFLIAAILLIGGWMTFNARSIYDPEFGTFARINNFLPGAAGSYDYVISLAWMLRAILLFGALLFVVDLSQSDRALLRLWGVIAVSGGSVALLGLLEKASGAKAIFWQTEMQDATSTFFGPYYYHANAGAYLNMVLPFTAGLALRAFAKRAPATVQALWLTLFLLNLAAVAANTSRMAQFVGLLIVLALAVRFTPTLIRRLSRSETNVALAGAAAVLFLLFAIGKSSHLEQPLMRWEKIGEQVSVDARWAAARVGIDAVSQAGLLGFGPGTFRAIFPAINARAEQPVPGEWRFLHQDYLQTVLEWGWLGATIWCAIFLGGITVAIKGMRHGKAREWSWRRRLILFASIVAVIGVAVHALVDFPFQIESLQLYAATCLGLCWASALWKRCD